MSVLVISSTYNETPVYREIISNWSQANSCNVFFQLTAESFNRKIACQETKDELEQAEKEMKILSNKTEAQKIRLRKRIEELQKLMKE